MSKLPQLNLRIADHHHDLIRQIAQRLREQDGDSFAAHLTAFLEDAPRPVQADLGERVRLTEIQLELLADQVASLMGERAALSAPTGTKRLTKGMVKSSLKKI